MRLWKGGTDGVGWQRPHRRHRSGPVSNPEGTRDRRVSFGGHPSGGHPRDGLLSMRHEHAPRTRVPGHPLRPMREARHAVRRDVTVWGALKVACCSVCVRV